MADKDNPFASLAPQAVDNPFGDLAREAAREPAKPLDLMDRLKLTLLFDTQPKRRAAYLKQRGYELDPKDENKYRPIGSKEKFVREIDPLGAGNPESFKQYAREVAADLIEGAGTLAQGAAEAGSFGAGGPAGRALAFNVIESGKDVLGDLALDESLPPDYALRAAQTAYGAILPEAIQGGTNLAINKVIKPTLTGISNGVRKLYKFGGGNVSDSVWEALKKDWKLLSDDGALKAAGDTIDDTVESIYGMEKGSRELPKSIQPGSLFQKKLDELEPLRRQEASKLSGIGQASFSTEELLQPLLAAKDRIEQKPVLSDAIDEPALKWINDKIGQVVKGGRKAFTFGEVDDVVKTLQKDAYKGDEPWRTQYVQGLVEDVNGLLKSKAEALGSPYAAVKEQESKVFQAFSKMRKAVNKDTARGLIVGGLPTGADSTDVKQKALTEAIGTMDEALGTQIGEGLRTNQIQNQIFKVMESSSRPKGSGALLSAVIPAAGATAAALGSNPITRPLAIPGGALAGGVTAAALNPSMGLPLAGGASEIATRLGTAAAPEAQDQIGSLLRNALAAPGRTMLSEPVVPKQEEDNPFSGL